MDPKYPDIKVELIDGPENGFSILVRVRDALKKAGIPKEEIKRFVKEASTGDYDHLLITCCKWVDVK